MNKVRALALIATVATIMLGARSDALILDWADRYLVGAGGVDLTPSGVDIGLNPERNAWNRSWEGIGGQNWVYLPSQYLTSARPYEN